MPRVPAYDASGAPAGELELPEAVFGQVPHGPALHQATVAEMANRRAGTHSARTRGEVRGGGRKPWRQKGTGRARAGSRRSPLWTGGGITFGPKPRDYSQVQSRSLRRLALRSALSAQVRAGRVVVLDSPPAAAPRTKEVAAILNAMGLQRPLLIVAAEDDAVLARAAANLRDARVLSARRLAVQPVLASQAVVITKPALAVLQEALGS